MKYRPATTALMRRALELAEHYAIGVSPNPSVGAVVVKNGTIVGEGYTQPPGGPHAEAVALRQAGNAAHDASLYVTLEPCCHYGRTPPCTQAIIAAGISNVHVAMVDPDPHVNGQGLAELEEAGIRIHIGDGEEEAKRLNEAYVKHRRTGLPFVIGKFACSLDGRIAARSGEARWISGPKSQAWIHQLRARVDAIMIGVNTLLADDPLLTARPNGNEEGSHQPIRIVVDSQGRTPRVAQILTSPPSTLIATTERSDAEWRREISEAGAEILVLPQDDGLVDLRALLRELGDRGIISLLVDGGGVLLGSLFDQRLVDKAIAIIAPLIIGAKDAPAAVAGEGAWRLADAWRLTDLTVERFGNDIIVVGYPATAEISQNTEAVQLEDHAV